MIDTKELRRIADLKKCASVGAMSNAIEEAADEIDRLRERVGELEAARIAYASEFPFNDEGEPDVGSIHANIRNLKKELKVRVASLEHQLASRGGGGMSIEELIDSMCMTWRHDFGIDKRHGPLGYQGTTADERNALRSQMRQLLDHHGEQIAELYAGQPTPENEAVRRDAERYRYLRDRSGDHGLCAVSIDYWSDEYLGQAACDVFGGAYLDQEIDAAIDAAIARRGEGGE